MEAATEASVAGASRAGCRPHLSAPGVSAPQRNDWKTRHGPRREWRRSRRGACSRDAPRPLAPGWWGRTGLARAWEAGGSLLAPREGPVRSAGRERGATFPGHLERRGRARSRVSDPPPRGRGLRAQAEGSPAAFSWAPGWQDARGGSGSGVRGAGGPWPLLARV